MAAKDGFETVWSNGMRYLIVAGVGEIMMFLGKLMIAAGTTALFYVLITFVESIKMNIIEPIYMLLVNLPSNIDRVHHFVLYRRVVYGHLHDRHGHNFGLLHH